MGSTTRLPSHSAQVEETRKSLYDSESGVKKMAVGHHLGECSHTIERSHNLLSGERVERQDFVNLDEGEQDFTLEHCEMVIGVGLEGSEVWDQCGVWARTCLVPRPCPPATILFTVPQGLEKTEPKMVALAAESVGEGMHNTDSLIGAVAQSCATTLVVLVDHC